MTFRHLSLGTFLLLGMTALSTEAFMSFDCEAGICRAIEKGTTVLSDNVSVKVETSKLAVAFVYESCSVTANGNRCPCSVACRRGDTALDAKVSYDCSAYSTDPCAKLSCGGECGVDIDSQAYDVFQASVPSPPVVAPATTPVAMVPVAAPVTAPMTVPVAEPVAAPVAAPAAAPIATPVAMPVSAPVVAPVAAPVSTPVVYAPFTMVSPQIVPIPAPETGAPSPAPVVHVVAPVDTNSGTVPTAPDQSPAGPPTPRAPVVVVKIPHQGWTLDPVPAPPVVAPFAMVESDLPSMSPAVTTGMDSDFPSLSPDASIVLQQSTPNQGFVPSPVIDASIGTSPPAEAPVVSNALESSTELPTFQNVGTFNYFEEADSTSATTDFCVRSSSILLIGAAAWIMQAMVP